MAHVLPSRRIVKAFPTPCFSFSLSIASNDSLISFVFSSLHDGSFSTFTVKIMSSGKKREQLERRRRRKKPEHDAILFWGGFRGGDWRYSLRSQAHLIGENKKKDQSTQPTLGFGSSLLSFPLFVSSLFVMRCVNVFVCVCSCSCWCIISRLCRGCNVLFNAVCSS